MRFCSVAKGKTTSLEQDEPERVAEAAFRLGLKHVVITSVTRDDRRTARSILPLHSRRPRADRRGGWKSSRPISCIAAGPRIALSKPRLEVFNHNTETVPGSIAKSAVASPTTPGRLGS